MRERLDEIRAAEFGGIASRLARSDLDDAFDEESRLGTPRAANRVDRRGVGVDSVDLGVDGGNVVLAGEKDRIEIGRHHRPEGRGIGAQIGDRVDAQAEHLAIGVERQFGVRDVVAAVRVGEEGFRALRRPLHRPIDLLGRPGADRLLIVDEDLRAEAAADVGRDDAQLVLGRDPLECREHQTGDMWVLARRVQRRDIGARIVFAERGARLHGVGNDAVVDEVELGDMRRFGESGVRRRLVADMPVVDGVVWREIVHLRLAGIGRACRLGRGGQHAIVDDDCLRRVLGLQIAVRDDDGDGIADIERLAVRQSGKRAHLHRRAVLGMDRPAADMRADLVGGRVRAGEDRDDAWRTSGGLEIKAVDRRMRVRRAHKIGVGLPRTIDVVGIVTLAGDETNVFLALDGCANAGRVHTTLPIVAVMVVRRRAPSGRSGA